MASKFHAEAIKHITHEERAATIKWLEELSLKNGNMTTRQQLGAEFAKPKASRDNEVIKGLHLAINREKPAAHAKIKHGKAKKVKDAKDDVKTDLTRKSSTHAKVLSKQNDEGKKKQELRNAQLTERWAKKKLLKKNS